ncbi:MAG: BlaI/MecI/CopY family transcriptional regulator [Phycisphaerae bacterium]|nr:BlaI/MecI/CopY family transcriptional regulator [Phycisphaerae bacterium]
MARKSTTSSRSARSADYHLPNAELDVLACLWQDGQATARRIREKMKRYRPMAHGSVVTLLVRLEQKGLVAKEKGPVGKAFVFRATRKPEPTYRALLKDTLHRVFGGDTVKMVTSLFEAQTPTADELPSLQSLVAGLKVKAKKKAGRR